MKTKYIVTLACSLLALASCVKDLETIPLNPWDPTADAVYGTNRTSYVQGLARLYFNFTTNDTTDLSVSDAGASELIRSFWSCQEVSTDEVKCAWTDTWAKAINTNTYEANDNNDMTYAVFVRTLQGVSYINEYLRQTAPERLEVRGVDSDLKRDIEGFRAEARFLRAYYYWMAMDIFGDVPFTTENDAFGELPDQKSRKEVYEFIVDELEELVADGSAMPEAASNRPRADKGAALGLLARVYLNAEVYTGEPAWDLCRETCKKIFTLGKYSLSSNYASLFRGDNGENPDAYKEFLFSAYYDQDIAQSWGGATYLTCGAADPGEILEPTDEKIVDIDTIAYTKAKDFDAKKGHEVIYKDSFENEEDWKFESDSAIIRRDTIFKQISRLGIGNGWTGLHVHNQFVATHFKPENVVWEGEKDADGNALVAGRDIADERGYAFHTDRRSGGEFTALENTFFQGWGCWKYNNIPHNESGMDFWLRTRCPDKQTSIDFPLIRLGEIYLIYAEACVRSGQEIGDAQVKMQELSQRAGVTCENFPAAWNDEAMKWFREERGRELYWEGHRRTDLIRYESYWQEGYIWPFKGGEANGKSFESYKALYPLPSSQLKANPDWHNPAGY